MHKHKHKHMHYVLWYNLVVNYSRSYRESCNVRSTYINNNSSGNDNDDVGDSNNTKPNDREHAIPEEPSIKYILYTGRKTLNIYINKYAIARSVGRSFAGERKTRDILVLCSQPIVGLVVFAPVARWWQEWEARSSERAIDRLWVCVVHIQYTYISGIIKRASE